MLSARFYFNYFLLLLPQHRALAILKISPRKYLVLEISGAATTPFPQMRILLRNGVAQALKSISCGYISVKQTGPDKYRVQFTVTY